MNYLSKIILLIVVFSFNINAKESENRILFKIEDKAFTDIDFERRIKYIKVINNYQKNDDSGLNKIEILEDFISSLICIFA